MESSQCQLGRWPHMNPQQAGLWFPAPRGIIQELGTRLLIPPPRAGLILPWSNGTGFPRKHENMRRVCFREVFVCLEEPAKSTWRAWTLEFKLSIVAGRNLTVQAGGVTTSLTDNDFRGT